MNAWLHPRLLFELDYPVNLGQLQTLLEGKPQIPVVNPVVSLVAEIGDQLLAFGVVFAS